MRKIRRMYKIHCEGVATGEFNQPSCNGLFYETFEEAMAAARSHSRDGAAMVIYKAHKVVQKVAPPVEVSDVNSDGTLRVVSLL